MNERYSYSKSVIFNEYQEKCHFMNSKEKRSLNELKEV